MAIVKHMNLNTFINYLAIILTGATNENENIF